MTAKRRPHRFHVSCPPPPHPAAGSDAAVDPLPACFIPCVQWISEIHLWVASIAAEPFLIHVFVHMNKHCWDSNLGSSVQCVADALPNEPCQVCIAIFAVSFIYWSYDGSKCKLKCQLVQEDYISMLQTSLVLLIFNGTARTQLAILAFMYCEEFVKNSVAASYYLNASVTYWHRKWDANIILCWYVLLCMFEIWSVMYA